MVGNCVVVDVPWIDPRDTAAIGKYVVGPRVALILLGKYLPIERAVLAEDIAGTYAGAIRYRSVRRVLVTSDTAAVSIVGIAGREESRVVVNVGSVVGDAAFSVAGIYLCI